jgi:hypothetical protein
MLAAPGVGTPFGVAASHVWKGRTWGSSTLGPLLGFAGSMYQTVATMYLAVKSRSSLSASEEYLHQLDAIHRADASDNRRQL